MKAQRTRTFRQEIKVLKAENECRWKRQVDLRKESAEKSEIIKKLSEEIKRLNKLIVRLESQSY